MKKICFAAALLLLMFCFSVFPASAKEYQENGKQEIIQIHAVDPLKILIDL